MHDGRRGSSAAFRMYEQRVRGLASVNPRSGFSMWGGVKIAQQSLAEGRPADALKVYLSLINACEWREDDPCSPDKKVGLIIHGNCGNLLVRDSQFTRATQVYAKALAYVDEGDDIRKGHLMHNTAVALVLHGNMKEALTWLEHRLVASFPFSAFLRKGILEGSLCPSSVPAGMLLDSLYEFSGGGRSGAGTCGGSLRPKTALRPPIKMSATYSSTPPMPVLNEIPQATPLQSPLQPVPPVPPACTVSRPRTAGFTPAATPNWYPDLTRHSIPVVTLPNASTLVTAVHSTEGYFTGRWGPSGTAYLVRKQGKHDPKTTSLIRTTLLAMKASTAVIKLKRVVLISEDAYLCYEYYKNTVKDVVRKAFIDPRVIVSMARRLLHAIGVTGDKVSFEGALSVDKLYVPYKGDLSDVVIGAPEAWEATNEHSTPPVTLAAKVLRYILKHLPTPDEEQASATAYLLEPLITAMGRKPPPSPIDIFGDTSVWRDLGMWMKHRDMVLNSMRKIDLVRGYLKELTRDRVEYYVVIDRREVREGCTVMFSGFVGADLLSPLNVTFAGESAVDLGGVANELCTEYVKSLLPSFESGVSAEGLLRYYPSPSADVKEMYAFGRLLLKCLIDGRSLELSLPPVFFKYIVGGEWPRTAQEWVVEMGAFDGEAARRMGEALEGRVEGGEGVVDACEGRVGRGVREQMDAVKRGFEGGEVTRGTVVAMLGAYEVMRLLCGEEKVTGEAVVANIEFRNWEEGDSTPYYLCTLLRELPLPSLRCFLRLCTGTPAIPAGGFPSKIAIFKSPDRFYAHTCFHQLSLPEYPSLEDLQSALTAALTSLHLSPQLEDYDADDV